MNTLAESRVTITQTVVAKTVKAVLKKAYPTIKFSVRTSKYSMGSSITVYWTDGPMTTSVYALIGHYCGASFDGMTDSKSYHDADTTISEDGTITHVHYANDYIFTSREVSNFEEKEKAAFAYILEHCACDTSSKPYRFGNDWVDNLARAMVYATDYTKNDTIETAFRRVIMRESI